jgi:hypothetical protein
LSSLLVKPFDDIDDDRDLDYRLIVLTLLLKETGP